MSGSSSHPHFIHAASVVCGERLQIVLPQVKLPATEQQGNQNPTQNIHYNGELYDKNPRAVDAKSATRRQRQP
jgi:hypothetical protein